MVLSFIRSNAAYIFNIYFDFSNIKTFFVSDYYFFLSFLFAANELETLLNY